MRLAGFIGIAADTGAAASDRAGIGIAGARLWAFTCRDGEYTAIDIGSVHQLGNAVYSIDVFEAVVWFTVGQGPRIPITSNVPAFGVCSMRGKLPPILG